MAEYQCYIKNLPKTAAMLARLKNKCTLVIIDTANHRLAEKAIARTISQIHFDDVLIFTDEPRLWGNHEIKIIPKIKHIDEYNRIVLMEMPNFIRTDRVLIIQYDGFALNKHLWESCFEKFDYIGAPWHDESGWIVGNGGFSLRSRRLIESVASNCKTTQIASEDVLICKSLRLKLQLCGLEFSPLEIARRFAFEWPIPKMKTFGFHGIFNLPHAYINDIDFLLENLPIETLERRWRHLFAGFCIHAPHRVEDLRARLIASNISKAIPIVG